MHTYRLMIGNKGKEWGQIYAHIPITLITDPLINTRPPSILPSSWPLSLFCMYIWHIVGGTEAIAFGIQACRHAGKRERLEARRTCTHVTEACGRRARPADDGDEASTPSRTWGVCREIADRIVFQPHISLLKKEHIEVCRKGHKRAQKPSQLSSKLFEIIVHNSVWTERDNLYWKLALN